MKNIQLELTEDQYGDLLKLVYLGNWLANGIYLPQERDAQFDEIEQAVMSKAEEAGFGDLIVRDEKSGRYSANALFENQPEIQESIDDYDDEAFWDGLVMRLTERDLINDRGADEVQAMGLTERLRAEVPFLRRYDKEVEKYGVDRLFIKE